MLLLTWAGLAPAGSRQLCLAHSFDHLIGAGEQRGRDRETEGIGRLAIDYKLVLGRRLNRKVGRLLALEDAIDIAGGFPESPTRSLLRTARPLMLVLFLGARAALQCSLGHAGTAAAWRRFP